MTITLEKLPELAQIYNISINNESEVAIYLNDENAKKLYNILYRGCVGDDFFNAIGNWQEILDKK